MPCPLRLAAITLSLSHAACASSAPSSSGEATAEAPAPVVASAAAAASATAASATGSASSEPSPAPTANAPAHEERYVVAAMGDSLTDPKSHGGKYLDVLRRKCPESQFDSFGVGGNMVNQMRKRLLPRVFGAETKTTTGTDKRLTYTHLLVLGGINDIISDETALRTNDKIERDLSWMYAEAKKRGLKVIAVTLPPWGGLKGWHNPRRQASTEAINRWIRGAEERGEVDGVFDVYPLMSCGSPTFLCDEYAWPDGAHWTKKGHEVMGKALYEAHFHDCR